MATLMMIDSTTTCTTLFFPYLKTTIIILKRRYCESCTGGRDWLVLRQNEPRTPLINLSQVETKMPKQVFITCDTRWHLKTELRVSCQLTGCPPTLLVSHVVCSEPTSSSHKPNKTLESSSISRWTVSMWLYLIISVVICELQLKTTE